MNKTKIVLGKAWKVLRWVLLVAVIILIAMYAFGTWVLSSQYKYALQLVEKMKTDRVTLVDVMGGHLPPQPDEAENGATLEGVDANHNGIRDDVELAIFKLHPSSARIRAAELQYAKYLQYTMDDGIYTRVVEQVIDDGVGASASRCLIGLAFSLGGTTKEQIDRWDSFKHEVEPLVLNNAARRAINERFNNLSFKYAGQFIYVSNDHECDVDPGLLQN